ncbi:unnamed protein product [Rotaria sordida]|uniref:G-protein coupled receptors family 1 profile domain-containing protein n=1 Tax=Rotaria sordida TaxID=392033 RepID=A0A815K280_9BILA|nr:unnamed protein product [Rotaria sordida]CAF1619811.1 unnamed protein product [Rotaria sordida]
MSTTFSFIGKQIIIYCGTPIFISGICGGLLNTLVLLSLRTFRKNSCAFYLIIMSIFNIGQLFTGLFSRIMIALYDIDGTETSLFYCKFRFYLFHICTTTSLTCLCLATFDQYCSTCSRPRWQQLCNIKLAHRLVIISIIIWALHGIPFLVYFNHIQSSITKKITCTSTNIIFTQYRAFFIIPGLIGYLPVTIATLFGLMAYYNVQQATYREVPLIRRELDKQLTIMVLVQVIVNIFTIIPYITVNAIATNPNSMHDPVLQANLLLVIPITLVIYYIYFASPFYIYICASERFRRQLIYVLFTIHLNRCRRPRMITNQVIPET